MCHHVFLFDMYLAYTDEIMNKPRALTGVEFCLISYGRIQKGRNKQQRTVNK